MSPPDAPPPRLDRPGQTDKGLGKPDADTEYPACPYCTVIYQRPNRAERRRRQKTRVPVPAWIPLHADQCPLVGENYVPGHLVVGRTRSAVRP